MSRVRMGVWLGLLLGVLLALPAKADTVVYYLTDTLHSTVVVTDAQRNVIETTHYAPYGQVLNRSLRNGPGYGGHEEDAATGLVYMQQRYYDPETGRFLSVDPVQTDGNGGSFNRYWYANDNPYRYTDPDGRMIWNEWHRPGTLEAYYRKYYPMLAAGKQSNTKHAPQTHENPVSHLLATIGNVVTAAVSAGRQSAKTLRAKWEKATGATWPKDPQLGRNQDVNRPGFPGGSNL